MNLIITESPVKQLSATVPPSTASCPSDEYISVLTVDASDGTPPYMYPKDWGGGGG